ncbi:hypothetical protein GTY67_12250 [Streptomyces sp. SID8374]|uniref:hypothetical protein n=1 Tax=Streptomyces sp. SID8374 TaxID=2690354 RepID=UPI00136ECA15|nr:hypothetical protein [Streptomyces sp. SID8374]MYX14170.1 hypothetical protein [Streptomyces sp. SID8374]
MRLVTRIAVNTVCATALLALVSCGADADSGPFGDLSGPEVTNKALTTTKKAESMRLSLHMDTKDGRMKADFSTSTSGECTGTMAIGPKGTVEIIKTGDTVYTKYDEALLRQESEGEPAEEVDATVKMLAGRWMESKASDPDTKDMIEFCDLKGLLKSVEANDTEARKAGEAKVDGKPALRLTEKEGKETHTFLVAAEGDPYILRITSKGGEEPMTLNLSEFNQPVVAEKPAAKDIVELGQ